MKRLPRMIGLGLMCCLPITASCSTKLDRNAPIGGATVQCQADCVQVSKGFVKEHAELFDELIRTKAALKMCQEKH